MLLNGLSFHRMPASLAHGMWGWRHTLWILPRPCLLGGLRPTITKHCSRWASSWPGAGHAADEATYMHRCSSPGQLWADRGHLTQHRCLLGFLALHLVLMQVATVTGLAWALALLISHGQAALRVIRLHSRALLHLLTWVPPRSALLPQMQTPLN